MRSVRVTTRETGTLRGTARRQHFSLSIIFVTVQLRIQVFWVRSVYFNVRNILPKSGTFPPGYPLYRQYTRSAIFFNFLIPVTQCISYYSRSQKMPDFVSTFTANTYQMADIKFYRYKDNRSLEGCSRANLLNATRITFEGWPKNNAFCYFSETIITIIMKFKYIIGTSFTNFRLFFH